MSRIGFHPEALREFVESAAYYESQQPMLGQRFVDVVEEAMHRIGTHPQLYPVIEANVRKCRVSRFPYGMIYRVKEDRIEIVAVMHLRREPGYWKQRVAPYRADDGEGFFAGEDIFRQRRVGRQVGPIFFADVEAEEQARSSTRAPACASAERQMSRSVSPVEPAPKTPESSMPPPCRAAHCKSSPA